MSSQVVKSRDDIQTEVFDWLKTTRYASSSLEPLPGGSANFIYKAKLILPLDNGSTEVVVKHGEAYMAVAPENKISVARCNVEAECFQKLADFAVTVAVEEGPETARNEAKINSLVKTPKLYFFDEVAKTQVMEYLPKSTNLKAYIYGHLNSPNLAKHRAECHALGKAIGEYIAAFHANINVSLRETLKGNSQMQDLKHMINFDWMIERVAGCPEILGGSRDVFEQVKKMALGELENQDRLKVIHGDLSPGNILIADLPLQALSTSNTPILIADWEQAQLGSPSLDHGEMLGELFAFHLYKNFDSGLWIAQGYIEGLGEQTQEQKWRNALQVGVHLLAFGPIAGWVGDSENGEREKARVVGIARDLVVYSWEKNGEWFREGEGKVFGFLV